MTYTIAEYKIN